MVDFRSSTSMDHFHLRYILANISWWRFLLTCPLSMIISMSLRDHVAILDFPRQGRLVDFWSSTFFDHFHHGIFWQCFLNIFVHQCTKYAMLYVSQESVSCRLGFAETRPDHEFLVFYFSFITIEHFAFIYHRSPRCRQPSTIATPRCHSQSTPALAFTIDRCAFIHHRLHRFHLVWSAQWVGM